MWGEIACPSPNFIGPVACHSFLPNTSQNITLTKIWLKMTQTVLTYDQWISRGNVERSLSCKGIKCFSKKLAGFHRERWLEESPRTRTKFAPENTYGLCATWEANVWTHESIITVTENILWMCPANERRCYIVTSFRIAWTHTHNDPCCNPKEWHLF